MMAEYEVRVVGTLSRIVTVEAENAEDAQDTVETQYTDEEIVLDAEDYDGVVFEVI